MSSVDVLPSKGHFQEGFIDGFSHFQQLWPLFLDDIGMGKETLVVQTMETEIRAGVIDGGLQLSMDKVAVGKFDIGHT